MKKVDAYRRFQKLSIAGLIAIMLAACGVGKAGPTSAPASGGATMVGKLMGGSRLGVALNLTPAVSIFAGTVSTFLDATGAAASFNGPGAVVSDGTNLYVEDSTNNAFRKIQ